VKLEYKYPKSYFTHVTCKVKVINSKLALYNIISRILILLFKLKYFCLCVYKKITLITDNCKTSEAKLHKSSILCYILHNIQNIL